MESQRQELRVLEIHKLSFSPNPIVVLGSKKNLENDISIGSWIFDSDNKFTWVVTGYIHKKSILQINKFPDDFIFNLELTPTIYGRSKNLKKGSKVYLLSSSKRL